MEQQEQLIYSIKCRKEQENRVISKPFRNKLECVFVKYEKCLLFLFTSHYLQVAGEGEEAAT